MMPIPGRQLYSNLGDAVSTPGHAGAADGRIALGVGEPDPRISVAVRRAMEPMEAYGATCVSLNRCLRQGPRAQKDFAQVWLR